jgi:hypothetical protein
VSENKQRGGKRSNSGRKANEAKAAVVASGIDGRTLGGKDHANWLLEQLNQIDPDMMRDLNLPPEVKDAPQQSAENKLKIKAAEKRFRKLSFEIQGWARLWFNNSFALDTRRYLYDKAGHQAVKIINHVHDKPIEVNMNLSLGERMKAAMKKADERVSDRYKN